MPNRQPDVTNLPLDDLLALQQSVSSAVEKQREAKKQEVLAQIQNLVKQYDLPFEDVVRAIRGHAKRGKAPAIYRDPDNPRKTWSGKGEAPDWFRKCKDPNSLRII